VVPLSGDGWSLDLPDGLIAKPHKAWGYESGAIARGWIEDAPVTVIVQVAELETGFNQGVAKGGAWWLELDPPRRVTVRGAGDAVRLDGFVEFDGLGALDDREQCIAVCAKHGRQVVGLTIRSRPEDNVQHRLEPIVQSFRLVT
jgi:hypothetical protein